MPLIPTFWGRPSMVCDVWGWDGVASVVLALLWKVACACLGLVAVKGGQQSVASGVLLRFYSKEARGGIENREVDEEGDDEAERNREEVGCIIEKIDRHRSTNLALAKKSSHIDRSRRRDPLTHSPAGTRPVGP